QVYAIELSYTGDRHLLQVSVGEHADSVHPLTATGRWQFDVTPRTVLVASGLFRDASSNAPRGGSAGLAIGIAPSSRLTVWTQADARFRDATTSGRRAYTLLSDAAFEVHRGVWLKLSPQMFTEFGDASAGVVRVVAGAAARDRSPRDAGRTKGRADPQRVDRHPRRLGERRHPAEGRRLPAAPDLQGGPVRARRRSPVRGGSPAGSRRPRASQRRARP